MSYFNEQKCSFNQYLILSLNIWGLAGLSHHIKLWNKKYQSLNLKIWYSNSKPQSQILRLKFEVSVSKLTQAVGYFFPFIVYFNLGTVSKKKKLLEFSIKLDGWVPDDLVFH